jgi:acyl carrier protein
LYYTFLMNISDRVESLIRDLFPQFDQLKSLRGQLDSIGLFLLLPKLEKEFGIEIFSIEANEANLATVESITNFVGAKLRKTKTS